MKFIVILLLLPLVNMLGSCSKSSSSSANITPANLSVSASVTLDSSGNVSFVASATNTVSYYFDFGDNTNQSNSSGVITHKYASIGTYNVNVIATSVNGSSISTSVQVLIKSVQTLLWSEEFNYTGTPDPTKWTFDIGNNSGWGNGEAEYYTSRPDNVVVQGGYLVITAKKESYSGYNYTSARLKTQGLYGFTYGKIEISAKLPSSAGTWPALWMLGSNISTSGWPACGEMDIMEQKASQLNTIFGTIHYPGHSGGGGIGSTTVISNASTQFHKYTLNWSAIVIEMYVDDNLYLTVPNNNSLPFNQNFFLLVNLAIGGTFGGTIDPVFVSDNLYVDYIRVYK